MMRLIQFFSPKYFALLLLFATLGGLSFLGAKILGWGGVLLGIAISGFLVERLLAHFVVFVPKRQGLIVMNTLAKDEKGEATMRTALSGFGFKYPWEQAKEDGYRELKEIRILVDITIPAKDGPCVRLKGSIVIAPDPARLIQYFNSEKVVADKVLDVVKNYLSSVIGEKNAEDARIEIKLISAQVTKFFGIGENATDEEKQGTDVVTSLERSYGIIFKEVTLAEIDFEDSFQNARATRKNIEKLSEAVKKEIEETGISSQRAWDNVFLAGGSDKVTKEIKEVTGIEGPLKMLALLFARFYKETRKKRGASDAGGSS